MSSAELLERMNANSEKQGECKLKRSEYTFTGPSEILELLKQKTPCEKFHCVNFDKCKSEELACPSFHYYVNTGRVLPPGTEFKKGKPHRIDGSAIPTHARYKAIFLED